MKIIVTDRNGQSWQTTIDSTITQPPRFVGWRCLHQAEGGLSNPDHMPVVRPSFNAPAVPMTKQLQQVDYRINDHNDYYTPEKWSSTHGDDVAFNNGNGFGDAYDPRANYVTMSNLSYPLPKYMKAIICGGSFYTGKPGYSLSYSLQSFFTVAKSIAARRSPPSLLHQHFAIVVSTANNVLIMAPGVDGVDARSPHNDVDEWAEIILAKHHYFDAVTRSGDRINNFPQGGGKAVRIAYFLTQPVSYPLYWFERWERDTLPDPLTIYHPL